MAAHESQEFSEMSGLKVGAIVVLSILIAGMAWAGIKKAIPALA